MIQENAKLIGAGTMSLLALMFALVVAAPRYISRELDRRSENLRDRTAIEERGRVLYIKFGCQYCHSQYVRRNDWGPTAERLSQAGDYVNDWAPQLGSNRNGPDLSHDGGQHSDDWQRAHFWNPRWTRPESIMPSFNFFSVGEMDEIVAYVQSLGGKLADARVQRQWTWRRQAMAAYEKGANENVLWLHSHVPAGWRRVPSPYGITSQSFAQGHVIYQENCLGCHGPVGDGQGPASAFIYPPPLNFTTLRRIGPRGGVSGGLLYYQIMNGITGSAMPFFKNELESEKIWNVGNFVARQFIGLVDTNTEPRGIDASYEPPASFEFPPNAHVEPLQEEVK